MGQVDVWVTSAIAAVAAAFVEIVRRLFVRVREAETRLKVAEDAIETYDTLEGAVQKLEIVSGELAERLKHMPTHKDLQLLHDRISHNGRRTSDLGEKVAAAAESVKGVRHAVDRLYEVELNRDKVSS